MEVFNGKSEDKACEPQQDISTYNGGVGQEASSYRRRARDGAGAYSQLTTNTPPGSPPDLPESPHHSVTIPQNTTNGVKLEIDKDMPPVVHRESARHFHEYILRDPNLLLHKATYIILYAASGFFTPYVALLLADAGADKAQIGAILALRPFVLMVANPLWGRFADAGYRRSVLVFAIAASATLKTCSVFCTTIPSISFFVIIADLVGAPMYSLLDASVLAILDATSVTSLFGNTRLMGSIGFGGFAPLAGYMADSFGLRITACTQLLFALPAAVLASFIPVELDKMHAAQAKTALRQLLQPDVILVLCISCIMGLIATMIRLYQFPFLKGLGAENSLMGFALTATCISEIPMFILSTKVAKLEVVPVLFLSLVCYTVRMAGYSILTDPLWTLPLELLHGCSIGLGLGAAIRFMHGCVPHEMASSALGVLSGVYTGLGPILGSLLGGFLFSAFGPHEMWRIASILATFGTVLVAVAAYRMKRNKALAAGTPVAGKQGDTADDPVPDAVLPDDMEIPTTTSSTRRVP